MDKNLVNLREWLRQTKMYFPPGLLMSQDDHHLLVYSLSSLPRLASLSLVVFSFPLFVS